MSTSKNSNIEKKISKKMSYKTFFFWSALLFIFSGTVVYSQSVRVYVDQLARQAVAESKNGNYSMAFQLINKAIGIQPKRLDLYYYRAAVIGRSGNYGKAIKEFSRFVARKNFPHAIRFRADCYMAVGMYKKATKDYLFFLKSATMDGKVWSYLAESLILTGNTKAALWAIQKGIATKSHWSERLMHLQKQILSGKQIVPHQPLSN